MCFGQAGNDRQAEPATSTAARPRRVDAVETLEHTVRMFRRDAMAAGYSIDVPVPT